MIATAFNRLLATSRRLYKLSCEAGKNPTLSCSLLVWILPITLGSLFLVAGIAYQAARRQILRDAHNELTSLAIGAAEQITAFLDQRNNDLATIAQSPLFRDHYMNEEYGLRQEAEVYRQEIAHMLASFARRIGVCPRLRYLDARGREVCRIVDASVQPVRGEASEAGDTEFMKSLRVGQGTVLRHMQPVGGREPAMRYAAALRDKPGALRGMLVFDCNWKPIDDILKKIEGGSFFRLYLTDRRGVAATASSAGYPAEGNISVSIPMPGTLWAVTAAARPDDLLEGLDIIATVTGLVGLIAAVFMALVIVYHVRFATRPLGELAAAVRAYARGELGARVRPQGTREVADLAGDFNEMADRLQQHNTDLEQRIRELTALKRMSDAVLHDPGRRAIGKSCLEAAVLGLDFQRGVLYWVDHERGEIAGECVFGTDGVGFTDEAIRRRHVPLDSSDILSHVVHSRETLHVSDGFQDARCNPVFLHEVRTSSFCLAPILGRDRVLGVIGVDRGGRGEISAAMARSLSVFCSAAGLALENARLLDAIVRSEERYRTAVEYSPDAIVGLDQNLRITLWNRRAEALFGYQPAEARGRTMEFLFGQDEYARLKRIAETKGVVRQAEVKARGRDNRILDMIVSWAGQPDERGLVREWFVGMQDVTERKRLQGELIQAEKVTAVGSLIAGIAHELNNPLTVVLGFSEDLLRKSIPQPIRDDIRQIRHSGSRCRDIVRGLLLFVRRQSVALRKVALNRAVEEALAFLEYRIVKGEDIRLEVDLDRDSPQVAADFHRVQQVVINLLSNAAEALSGRSGPRIIRLRTRRLPGRAVLEVEDTGPGVPQEHRAKLFQPFFTTKPKDKGTGLGLSISARIVGEFGGELSYDAAPEGGARFIASFPSCAAELPPAVDSASLPAPVPGRRVLLVDDEPDVLEVMSRMCLNDGLEIETTGSYAEALRRLKPGRFDLVIADVEMGAFKGTDLLEEAKTLGACTRFLFVTGDIFNRTLSERIAKLDAPYLVKPFLRTEFLRAVRRVLGTQEKVVRRKD